MRSHGNKSRTFLHILSIRNMAIYHFSMKMISRSKGRSSTACSAYRGGLDITDERTGEIFTYANKGKYGVLDHMILTPSRAPHWAKEASSLWNAVEHFEKRKDSQVARENIVALPHELTLEQNCVLLHGFVNEAYIKRGMVAQVDIHAPDSKGNNKNIHAHILMTTRQITRNGFKDKKPRNWNDKQTLKDWRKLWEHHVNLALEKAGHSERVDSRSFEDQGITDKEPSIHMGVEATAMERRGEDSRQGDKNKAVEASNIAFAKLKEERKIIDLAIEREERKKRRNEALYQAKQERRTKIKDTKAKNALKQKIPVHSADKKPVLQDKNAPPEIMKESQYQRQKERYKMESRQREELYEFEARSFDKRTVEKEKLEQFYKPQEHKRKLREAQKELEKKKGMFSRLTGKTQAQQEKVDNLKHNVDGIEKLQNQGITMFNGRLFEEKKIITQRHEKEWRDFDNTPIQKTDTAKSFEKAVVTKEVANENEKAPIHTQKRHRTRDRE